LMMTTQDKQLGQPSHFSLFRIVFSRNT
jgi:hypothetical protein